MPLRLGFLKKSEGSKGRNIIRFPGGSDGKASACSAGDPGSIPGLGRSPGEGNGNPTPVLLPGKFHGLRSLVGYSPWGRKELDTIEQLHFTSPSVSGYLTTFGTSSKPNNIVSVL